MSHELVTVATLLTAGEAEALRAMLAGEGITTAVSEDNVFCGAVDAIRLLADESNAALAREVLRRHGLYSHHQGADESDALKCLSCGAPMGEGRERCDACGWSYKEEVGTE